MPSVKTYIRHHGNTYQWGSHRIGKQDARASIFKDDPDLRQSSGQKIDGGYDEGQTQI